MKIRLIPRSAGTSGGGLRGNLRHLDKYIQQELDKTAFQSSFDEIWLGLSYPPLQVKAGMEEMATIFANNYQKLPYSRINRKAKTIDVILKAPEFSEHFQEGELGNDEDEQTIADEYKNIPEPELARILIDKYVEALQLIQSKLKKEDFIDFPIVEDTLSRIRQNITQEFLISNSKEETINQHNALLQQAEASRTKRMNQSLPADTLIRDIRMYFAYPLPPTLLYLHRYAGMVLRQLQYTDFKCPGYHHLYIIIAGTKEEALKKVIIAEDWYSYGVAVVKEETLLNADHSVQQALVLNALKEGLLDIAALDKLDKEKILQAINKAEDMGILSEQLFKAKENNKIAFAISTKTVLGLNEEEIYFTLVNKETNKTARWKFGQENILLIGGWFGTIHVTNKKITIKPRAHMDMVLEGRQKIIELDVEKELAAPGKAV